MDYAPVSNGKFSEKVSHITSHYTFFRKKVVRTVI